jgi:hypothetical protein
MKPTSSSDSRGRNLMKFNYLKIFLIACILVGIGIRIACYPGYYPEHGAVLQTAMGQSLFDHGDMSMKYGPIFDDKETSRSLSQHFPPLYPLIIFAYTSRSENILDELRTLSLRITLLSALIIFLLTRLLFGEIQSYLVTAGFILHGALIDNASKCLSENIQILLIMLFLASVMVSKKRKGFWILSGFFLGLAYLSKSTLPFWFTIGIVSFAVLYVSFKNRKIAPWLISALAVFILTILPWGLRNYFNFGTFETSKYLSSDCYKIDSDSLLFVKGLLFYLPLNLLMIAPFLIFVKEMRKANIKDPFDFLCIFFAAALLVLSILYSAYFYSIEHSLLPVNSIRYVLIAIVPLLMLIAKHTDFSNLIAIRKAYALISVLLISSVLVLIYAYTVTDKPLINEPDWVVSQKVVQCVSTLTEQDQSKLKTFEILFDDSINKNDFYYYYLALESAGFENYNLVHAKSHRPTYTRTRVYYEDPQLIIFKGENVPCFRSGTLDISIYDDCCMNDDDVMNPDVRTPVEPEWSKEVYRIISRVDSSGHATDDQKNSIRSLGIQETLWYDFFQPDQTDTNQKQNRLTENASNP